MKFLIVEDDEDSQVMLCNLLRGQGHDAVAAFNGKKALEVLEESTPDLIITDILMPEIDGFDFCRKVKNNPKLAHIPLIFYTATYTSKEDKDLGLLMGASRFVIKPQEPDALIKLIDEVIKEDAKNSSKTIVSHDILNKKQLETVGRKLREKVQQLEGEKIKKIKLDSKLIQLASDFHHVNEALSDFTFSASHDLMEPLRKISSFSSRLREMCGQNLDEHQQVYLSVIERSSLKMKRYIEDLGVFAEVSKADLDFRDIDLEEIFSEVLKKFSLEIRKSNAKFTLGKLHALVSDRLKLIKLFQTIISNSLKFRNENVPLEIHIKSQKTEDGFIEVSIEDSGMGFDEKYTDRIFKPFQKIHRDHQDQSSGMGLAICQKIVNRLGGSISAKSSLGKGSTFIVKLPLKSKI